MDQILFVRDRRVQEEWAAHPVWERLAILRRARQLIAERADEFMRAVDLGDRRLPVETIPLEIVPLLDAIRFLERQGARLLATQRLGRQGRPLWLFGADAAIRRLPYGRVLILAPFNYPLLLPGVQIVQALAAGNAVLVKPSPGHAAPLALLAECLLAAGLPPGLLLFLETIEQAEAALAGDIDKVVLTGSAATGRTVLAQAAEALVPAIVELSGNDAVFMLPGADLDMTVKALVFGLRLNGGATCIAPRRVYAERGIMPELERRLREAVRDLPPVSLPEAVAAQATRLLGHEAVQNGAMHPAIVLAAPDSGLLSEDIFFPALSLVPVATMEEALELDAACPYRLGAAVFGPAAEAQVFASRLTAGMVVINDLIAPTADPRLPFEGSGHSGFGPTRGAEGLLAMTRPQAVTLRQGRLRFHYKTVETRHAGFYLAFVRAFYTGDIGHFWRFLLELLRFRG